MDAKAKTCMNKFAEALVYTREPIRTVKPFKNRKTALDGTKYDDDVIEVTFTSGSKIYINVNCDSNLAAMYDVIAVLLDNKKALDPSTIEELIPMED